jgi:hypothetical protein
MPDVAFRALSIQRSGESNASEKSVLRQVCLGSVVSPSSCPAGTFGMSYVPVLAKHELSGNRYQQAVTRKERHNWLLDEKARRQCRNAFCRLLSTKETFELSLSCAVVLFFAVARTNH